MMIIRTDNTGYEGAAQKAALALKAGGIVLYPTDTVYGLAVDAGNSEALSRLAALKGRDEKKTPLVVMPSIEAIGEYAGMNPAAEALAEKFLPGALTLVLPAAPSAPQGVVREDGTLGIRIPDDEFCLALSAAFGKPYTSTSANLAGEGTLATVEEILAQFGERKEEIAMVVDDGPRAGGTPSTIIAFAGEVPEIIREGKLSREALGL